MAVVKKNKKKLKNRKCLQLTFSKKKIIKETKFNK